MTREPFKLRCYACGRPATFFTIMRHPRAGKVLVCKRPRVGEAPGWADARSYCVDRDPAAAKEGKR